jgi:DNA-binding NarL/FixJ family response regulator
MQPNKVIIACTSTLFARYIQSKIQSKIIIHNSIHVSISQNVDDLRTQIRYLKPAVVLIEECFYKRVTAYVMGTIHDKYPKTRFAVFSFTEIEEHELAAFLNSGASSFINFRLDPKESAAGLDRVVSGDNYIPPNISCTFGNVSLSPLKKITLTKCEKIVMSLLAVGKKPDDIASFLGIKKGAVRKHKNHIYAKCGVHNTVELANFVNTLNSQKKFKDTTQGRTG